MFAPDSARLIAVGVGDKERLYTWTLASSERSELCVPDLSWTGALAVHPTGRFVFAAEIMAFRVISLVGEPHRNYPDAGYATNVIVSPDGRWIIAGPTRSRLLGFQYDGTGPFPDAPTWEVETHTSYETPGGFIENGEQFVSVAPRVLVIRNATTGQIVSTAPYPAHFCYNPTTSADGSRFAVQARGKLYMGKTIAWKKPVQVKVGRGLASFALHPTRPLLALRDGWDGVKYVDTDTGQTIREFVWHPGSGLGGLAFSPDGALAAVGSAGGKIVVWDVDECAV